MYFKTHTRRITWPLLEQTQQSNTEGSSLLLWIVGAWQGTSAFWTHRKLMVFLDIQRRWHLDLQHYNEYKFITVRCFKSCIPIWRMDDHINSMTASSRCMIVHPHVANKFRTNLMLCNGRWLNNLDLLQPDLHVFRWCKRAPYGDKFMSASNVQYCSVLVYAAV